jgi:hypothetical protein
MLNQLANLSFFGAAACLLLFFFGDIFMPSVNWFRDACAAAVIPSLMLAGALFLLRAVMPAKIR